jgi:4-hydroxy-2-oxoheptanedioate aldolase
VRPNTVKRLLQDGKPAVGTWLGLGSPLAAEWLAHLGFDWLNIEQEHGAIDATLTLSLLQAISTTDVIPLIRVPWKDPAYCKRALDAGAYGLFIPCVNTREEAEMIVGAMKYPPQGYRGLGGTRRTLYGGADYVKHANEEIMVILMIESAEGVRNAEDILSVPGVDACFVGPNDLAASLGLAPTLDPLFPEYEAAIAKIFQACKQNGVAPGLHTPNAARAADRIEQGWQLIAINSDGGFMAQAAGATVSQLRERLDSAAAAPGESTTRAQY